MLFPKWIKNIKTLNFLNVQESIMPLWNTLKAEPTKLS